MKGGCYLKDNLINPTKNLSTTQIILIVGIIAIIGAVAFATYYVTEQQKASLAANQPVNNIVKPASPGSGSIVVDKNNAASVAEELKRKAAENRFSVKMNHAWTFSDGQSSSADAYVANSTFNKKPFYFDLVENETGEVIYTSPIIPVGSAVKDFTLSKPLEAGVYECVCQYNLLNEDDTVASTVNIAVTVTVKG